MMWGVGREERIFRLQWQWASYRFSGGFRGLVSRAMMHPYITGKYVYRS